MKDTSPTDMILVSVIIIVGSTMIRNAKEGKTHFSPIVFGFMLATSLLFIAVVAPNFAKSLALMGLVGAFALNGPAVFGLTKQISGAQGEPDTHRGGPQKAI